MKFNTLVVFIGSFGLGGCTVIPGMHISETGSSAAYGLEAIYADGEKYYQLPPTTDEPAYNLVNLDWQTLKEARAPKGKADVAMAAVTPDSPFEEYVIGPSDSILVTVFDHPELSTPVPVSRGLDTPGSQVSAEGLFFFPYVGEFKAAGMTILQLRAHLASQLARVISEPQVEARVISFRSQRIHVVGEVRSPGLVYLDGMPRGVLEAIAERGGLTEDSSRRTVVLSRDGVSHLLDLGGLLAGQVWADNVKLLPGDIVSVPDRTDEQVYLLGEVERPQAMDIRARRLTLTAALAQGGGLDRLRADDSGVLVFRRPTLSSDVPTIFRLELDNPAGLLVAGEFDLQPRDVVYVKATGFSKYNSLIGQLLPTISAIFQLDRLVNVGR